MTVKILLITHHHVGSALLAAATSIFGELPLPTLNIPVKQDIAPEILIPQLRHIIEQTPEKHILILTDLLNATPCNIGKALQNNRIRIVSGVNLPMLIHVMNYPDLSLTELAKKALLGGRHGIALCEHEFSLEAQL